MNSAPRRIRRHHRLPLVAVLILSTVIGVILLRQPLFRALFSYQALAERRISAVTTRPSGKPAATRITESEVIDDALRATADTLSFTTGKCSRNPAELMISRDANCVGYAAFFCAEFNRRAAHAGISERYRAVPFIGKIRFMGFDIHSLFSSPFFKDHDFAIVIDTRNGNRTAVDPSLYDYTGIGRVRLRR